MNYKSWSKRSTLSCRIASLFVSGFMLTSLTPSLQAQSGNWNVDAAGVWSLNTNWLPAVVPGNAAGDIIQINSNITAARIVTIDTTPRIVGALTIGDSNATHAFTLDASGGATLTFDNSGSGATLTKTGAIADVISAPIILADNLLVSAGGSLTLSGIISQTGTRTLTKIGGGALVLSGANTYTGATTIGTAGSAASGGILTLSGASGSINLSSGYTINGAGSQLNLDYVGVADGAVDRIGNVAVTLNRGGELRMNGNTTAGTSSSESFGTLTLGTGNAIVTINNGGSGASIDTLTAAAFDRGSNFATALIRGSNMGVSTTAASRLILTSQAGLTQIGTSTSASGLDTGSVKDLTIVPYFIGATSAGGVGTNFVTYDTTSGLRRLGTNEQSLVTAGLANENVKSTAGANAVTGAQVFNSLLVGAGASSATPATTATTVTGDGNSLTLTSGALANVATSATGSSVVSGFSSIIFGTSGANEAVITNTNTTAGGDLTISSPINTAAAGGGLTKAGGGPLILSAGNLYTGVTTVNGGALRIQNASALGTTAGGTVVNGTLSGAATNARLELVGGITVTGESLTINGNGNFNGALGNLSGNNEWAGNVTIGSVDTRIGSTAGNLTVSGVIDSGANNYGILFRMATASSVTLSGANTYLGDTIIGSTGTGTLILSGGANRLPTTTRLSVGVTTVFGVLDLNGQNQEVAGIFVGQASGTFSNEVKSATAATFTVNTAAASPSSYSGLISGAISLVKKGPDMLTLSGVNTFSGSTQIDAGTLALTGPGKIGTGNVIVNGILDISAITPATYTLGTAQVLSGDGTINATGKTLNVNGTLAPGNSAGSLDVTGNVVLAGTTISNFEIDGPSSNDLLAVTGSLTYAGALNINTTQTTGSFDLFNFGSLSGDFSSIVLSNAFTGSLTNGGGGIWTGTDGLVAATFTGSTGVLEFTVIPEPSTLVLGGLALLGLAGMGLRKRRLAKTQA